MNAFERGLRREIPLEKAAGFFVGLKSWQKLSPEDDALLASAVKTAAAALAPAPAPAAPAPRALPDMPQVKSASLRFRLMALTIKEAAGETKGGTDEALSSPSGAQPPAAGDYFAEEAAGMEAEQSNALAFYQAKLEEARAETQAAQEHATELEQQVEQLSQTQQQSADQISAAQTEGQIAQQAALQQVQTANQAATTAMQQAVDAENRALMAKGQESAAKIQQQQVRSQLFDLASQGLPGTEPEVGAGNAAEGMAPEEAAAAGGAPGEVGAGAEGEGAEGAQEAAGAGGEGPGAGGLNEAGQPASAEGMPGQGASAEEPGAAAGPGAVQPAGDTSGGAGSGSGTGPQAAGDGSASAPEQDPSAKRQGQVSIKVGGYDHVRAKIAAALPGLFKDPRVVGALAGGALGAGAAGLEASGHGPDLDKIRSGIAEREAAPSSGGLKGFGHALELVKEKAKLGLGEATQAHPIPATITGGLMGAALGSSAGPRLADMVREAANHHKGA